MSQKYEIVGYSNICPFREEAFDNLVISCEDEPSDNATFIIPTNTTHKIIYYIFIYCLYSLKWSSSYINVAFRQNWCFLSYILNKRDGLYECKISC